MTLSKREALAGMAMQGLLSGRGGDLYSGMTAGESYAFIEEMGRLSLKAADAILDLTSSPKQK